MYTHTSTYAHMSVRLCTGVGGGLWASDGVRVTIRQTLYMPTWLGWEGLDGCPSIM